MKRSGNLHNQIVDELGRAIVSGQLEAGSVLPSEGELAAEMGVSRTIAREALKSLAARGMVKARPRAGTRVQPQEGWDCLNPEVLRWRLAGENRLRHLRSLLELRLLVEPPAARLAAERSDPTTRQEIWQAFRALVDSRDDHQGWIDAAARMHSLILGGCGNELLAGLGTLLRSAILESRNITRPALDQLPGGSSDPYPTPVDEALARYGAIATAIRDQDSSEAEAQMRGLLLRVEELFDHLSDLERESAR